MKFCPLCGEAVTTRFIEHRERWVCPSCATIHYRNPVPSVTCLIPTDEGIVLVKRKFDPGRGGWAFPGGFIDAEETASEAALREVKEETNLDVQLEGLLGVYSYVDAVKSGLVVMYQARPVGGTPQSGDDAEEVGCFALGELPPLVFESHRRALARWLSIRAAGGTPPPLL